MKKLYVISFDVSGSGEFPFDMLRYDACHPTQESEARLLASLNQRVVRLNSRGRTKNWQPTFERWRSFCWKVGTVQAWEHNE